MGHFDPDSRTKNPNFEFDVPAAAVGEVMVGPTGTGPTPTELARLNGYPEGAQVIQIPNASLAGVDPAALVPSRRFGLNDMLVVQTAKVENLPVITTNRRLDTQIHSGGPRQAAWGSVVVIVVPR